MRTDRRTANQLRPVEIVAHFQLQPAGSVLMCTGKTRVICAANIVPGVPGWMKYESASGGWLTGEYQMLPGATAERSSREVARGKPSGRSSEIQRLIGRSLRAIIDLEKIPGKTIHIDCDVLDADGGTRCAAVTGGGVALELACRKLFIEERISAWPLRARIAAVSVGIVDGEPRLDLCYEEDSAAEVDMNVIMTSKGEFVEIQGAAEKAPFSREQMDAMLDLARTGIEELFAKQEEVIAAEAERDDRGPRSN